MSYLQVIDSLAPLVGEKWGWLWVCRFDPWREKLPFVSLVPEVLVQVSVGDLLQRLHVVHRNEVGVEIHELDPRLLEGPLGQQVTLDPGEGLVGVVVSLLDQAKLLPLTLVQPGLDTET